MANDPLLDRLPDGALALGPGDPPAVAGYRLLARLGRGGMGTVYLARADAGPPVAVKLIRAELAADPYFVSRFRTEVDLARRVAPFCTAQVLDHGVSGGRPYLVTEYIDGPPLDAAVGRDGPLPASTAHGLAVGVAAALGAIHAAGLIHRDLKPGNVLLSRSGPRVIDFGIARALDTTIGHTRTGVLLGTPAWMAPEQLTDGPLTPAVDVFAWGALIGYAATGRHPYGTGDPAVLLHRIHRGEPDLAGMPASLARPVRAALDPAPRRRPRARELMLELVDAPAHRARAAVTEELRRTWAPPHAGRAGGGQATRRYTPPAGIAATAAAAGGSGGRPPRATRPTRADRDGRGGAAPGERPTRGRRRVRRTLAVLALAVLALVALDAAGKDGSDSGPGATAAAPEPTPTATRRPRPPPSMIGRPVRDGQLRFVVRSVDCRVASIGAPPFERVASGRFCLVVLAVRNVGTQARTIWPGSQRLTDTGGRAYTADLTSRLFIRGETLWDPISPGERAAGTLVFDVPAGVRPVRLELHDSPFSNGVRVRL